MNIGAEFRSLRAVADRLIVRQIDGPKQSSIIEMPDISKTFAYGEVLDVGPGECSAFTAKPLTHQTEIEKGDYVVFNTCGRKLRVNGNDFEIVMMNEVHAILKT